MHFTWTECNGMNDDGRIVVMERMNVTFDRHLPSFPSSNETVNFCLFVS